MGRKVIDLTGMRFGRLVVIRQNHSIEKPESYWDCVCDCGNTSVVRASMLKSGNTKSCGCLARELRSNRMKENKILIGYRHGLIVGGKTPLYNVWNTMRNRCNKENVIAYKDYGGRGIRVCDEWDKDYVAFHDWALNNGYREGLTIDRIDNDGDYEPNNCRWVTKKTQANNRRSNIYYEYNGERHTVSEWSDITGISQYNISQRIRRLGWSVEKTLTTPVGVQK